MSHPPTLHALLGAQQQLELRRRAEAWSRRHGDDVPAAPRHGMRARLRTRLHALLRTRRGGRRELPADA